ncbi:MAG: MarR family transcriptional regulator [Crocinitomicaceae bacterium]|nr:MarR family transcriptional regulator [Crocinitomicaceae bacterium]
MKKTLRYIEETMGIQPTATPLAKSYLDRLPMYIHETFKLYSINLFNTGIILAELKNEDKLSIQQTEKQVQQIKNLLNLKVVVVLENVQAYNRKRLIEKGINFIVPGKQLYMPDMLIDLRESFVHPKTKQKNDTLLPSAQFILIYHIIHRNQQWKLEEHPFKEIAQKLAYTPMAITNAIDNLKYHELIEVEGEKEKFIRFRYDRHELWNIAHQQNLLVNPVIKTVYVDEKPESLFLLQSNTSALPEYTDLNPSRQEYFAIEKTVFYDLQKSNALVNMNEYEGRYALEVWKYNPLTLVDELPNDRAVVDPLSLYLSVKESRDERIEMALEQILEKFIW